MRHKLGKPPRVEENTISWPSLVQANPYIKLLSKVICRGSPPLAGSTNKSLSCPGAAVRTKAMVEPSGEKAAPKSTLSTGGDVSGREVKSFSESNASQEWDKSALPSAKTRILPSGDQLRERFAAACNLCSVPPRAGTT